MALCNASHMHHTLMGLTWNLNASVGLVKLSSLQNWLDIRDKCFVIFRDISILFLYIFHRQHYILYSIVCGFVHVDGFPLPSPWHEMEEDVLLNKLISFIHRKNAPLEHQQHSKITFISLSFKHRYVIVENWQRWTSGGSLQVDEAIQFIAITCQRQCNQFIW